MNPLDHEIDSDELDEETLDNITGGFTGMF